MKIALRTTLLSLRFSSARFVPLHRVGPAAHTHILTSCSLHMAPKQATLGKFFGGGANENRSTAPPQQTKLAFSSKAKSQAVNLTEDEDEPENVQPAKAHQDNGDADDDMNMADGDMSATNGTVESHNSEVDGDRSNLEPESMSSSPARKRQPSEDEDADGSGEDEPPTKRQRVKSSSKPVKGAEKTVSASETKPEKSKAIDQENKDGETISTKATDPVQNSKGDETSASEDEEGEESEEEKPELAAKAREKVQSTLKSNDKHPYPDWKAGEPTPYAALCTTFWKCEMTTKRLEIMAHASLFLRQVLRLSPDDLLPSVLLMTHKLAADYKGIELGIGESLIMKAIGESTGRSLGIIKTDQQQIGDLGLVAAKSRLSQPTMFKPKPLTVRGVHQGLMGIATTEGQGAQARKIAGIKKLLSASDVDIAGKGTKGVDITQDKGGPSEAKFIIRTLEGKMRLGLAEKTVLVALAQAMVTHEVSNKSNKVPSTDQLAQGESILKSVYSEVPSYEIIIPLLLEHGISNLKDHCKLHPGVPVKPMLANPTKSITEILNRAEGKDFSCEYKYDGERSQIHFVAHDAPLEYGGEAPSAGKSEKGISNIFSRNSEDLSNKYPDILQKLPTWVKDSTKSFVLDCETVAWDVAEKKVLPFQQLMTRKRKDVKLEDVTVKVCVFAFDLLLLNGEPLVNKPFRERRELLHGAFNEVDEEFRFAQYGNTTDADQIQSLLEESVKASCEGLMIKMLDGVGSNYEPSRRSQNWLKVKKDYLSGVGDSLDLVVLGAYYGKGKRTSVYGAFLLACYEPNSQTYETVCNIGTGFSEQILEQLHAQLEPIIIEKPKPFYSHSSGNKDQPDVWFEPRYVWEVKTADLTVSPRYKAAADQIEDRGGGKGVSLRFPRFLKVREDKKPEDATTSRAVAEMYRKQEGVAKKQGPSVDDDFEY